MACGCHFLVGILATILLLQKTNYAFEITLGQNSKCSWHLNEAGLVGLKKDIEASIRAELRQELDEMKKQLDKYAPLLRLIPTQNATTLAPTKSPEDNITQTTTTPPKPCPDGYVQFEESCYDIRVVKLDWKTAKSSCEHEGAHLVFINSPTEQRFLAQRLRTYYSDYNFWIGMTSDTERGKKWTDGTTVNFTSWGIPEPSCFKQGCRTYMSKNLAFNWSFTSSKKIWSYICEASSKVQRKAVSKPTTCPVGYVHFEESCYDIRLVELDWNEAESSCTQEDAHLVFLNSPSEQRFLAERLGTYYSDYNFWIGMTSDTERGKKWTDGTTVNFTSWGISEPSCFKQGCRTFLSKNLAFNWSFTSSKKIWSYICETSPKVQRKAVYKSTKCPSGFTKSQNHCYKFVTRRKEWRAAREVCRTFGADLVSINSEAEQDFLEAAVRKRNDADVWDEYWIGLNYLPENYIWADGTLLNYTYWAQSEPNCMESTCKAFLSEVFGYTWEDADMIHKYKFICEIALDVDDSH